MNAVFARYMKITAGVHVDEIKAVWVSFSFAFFLMTSYYILRPMRDAMSSDWTDAEVSSLFTMTFLASILVTAVYGVACSRMKLSVLLPGVYIFFSATFFGFYVSFSGFPGVVVMDKFFYVWVSVFSLFQVSVFWSFMADVFTRQQASRLFGFIAAGSSVGALAGPALALFLIEPLGKTSLILLSALLLLIPVFAIMYLGNVSADKTKNDDTWIYEDRTVKLGGNPLSGFIGFIKDPYLLGIGFFLFLFTIISTLVYFELKNLLSGLDLQFRTQIWSGMDLAVNTTSLLISFFVTGRLARKMGLAWMLALVPVFIAMGLLVVAMAPMLWVVVVMQCVRRAGDYSITRPGREMLFTIVDREQRFKAKSVIDNVVYRGGDTVAAWGFTGMTQWFGLGLSGVAGVGVGIALLWAMMGVYLGKRYDRAGADAIAAGL